MQGSKPHSIFEDNFFRYFNFFSIKNMKITYSFTCNAGTVEYISDKVLNVFDEITVKGVKFKIIIINDSVSPIELFGKPSIMC